ncbi:MAG: 4Fe-4S dicluster-binding protein, partial [Bryocella sp.]
NLNYRVVAEIHADKCIGCQLCYTACWDGAHQCIHMDRTETPQPIFAGTDPRYTMHVANPHNMPTPDMRFAQTVKSVTTTPIPKLDLDGAGNIGPYATPLNRIPRVDEDECVGCNLCSLVCPVPDCITMERRDDPSVTPNTWAERVAKGVLPTSAVVENSGSVTK